MKRKSQASSSAQPIDVFRLSADARIHLLEVLSALVAGSSDPVKGCRLLVAHLQRATGVDYVAVRGFGDGLGELECHAARSPFRLAAVKESVEPIIRAVCRTAKPVLRPAGTTAVLAFPALVHRSVAGTLCLVSRRALSADPASLRFLKSVAALAAALIARMQGEHRLRGALGIHDALFFGGADAVVTIDPDRGVISNANPQATRLTGYREKELVGMKLSALFPRSDRKRGTAVLEMVQSGGSVTGYGPVDIVRAGGKRIPAVISARLISGDGQHNIVAIVRDLSEQKRSEAKLAASEELLRIIVEGTLDMFFFVHDTRGVFTYISPSVEKITGYSPKLWKDRYTKFLTRNPINQQAREYTTRALREGIAAPAYLCEVRHADGRPILLEMNEKPVLKGGRVIGIQGVARNITEKKRLEEAILESRDNLNRIVDQTPIAVSVFDSIGNLVDVNEAWIRLFGAARKEDVVGRVNAFHSKFFRLSGLAEGMATVYKGKIVDIPSVTVNPQTARPELALDGQEKTVHVRMFPVIDRDHSLMNVVAMIEDVTERRRLEEQLIQSQKMESIGLLAGGIAHDFNNILGGILGYASFLKAQVPKEEKIYPHLETIERSALRAAELTSQLLAFARGGKYVVGPISINELVTETAELLRGTLERSVAVETRLDLSSPVIEADASQIQQVLMNLCVNARDAMPGGGQLTITTKRLTEHDRFLRSVPDLPTGTFARIDITDTGFGIDKAIRGKIFDPFFTTKEKGKGTGLGLATVYGIVKNHGGLVNVESEVGVGTTFSVYLPAVARSASPSSVPSPRPLGGRETIMIVDDEETIRMLVKDILEEKGYIVLGAADGFEAVDLYAQRRGEIDLVILDMAMPGMGGREAFEKLKEMNPDIRAILSTGYSQDERAREMLARGVKAFVQKPYRIDDLAAAVRKVLDSPSP